MRLPPLRGDGLLRLPKRQRGDGESYDEGQTECTCCRRVPAAHFHLASLSHTTFSLFTISQQPGWGLTEVIETLFLAAKAVLKCRVMYACRPCSICSCKGMHPRKDLNQFRWFLNTTPCTLIVVGLSQSGFLCFSDDSGRSIGIC